MDAGPPLLPAETAEQAAVRQRQGAAPVIVTPTVPVRFSV